MKHMHLYHQAKYTLQHKTNNQYGLGHYKNCKKRHIEHKYDLRQYTNL